MNAKKFQIKVTDGKYIAARNHRLRLATFGLKNIKGKSGVYRGQVSSEAQVERVKSFFEKKGLTFSIDNKLSRRSSDYRKQFFKQNKPALIYIWYFCAYCGRPVRKKYVTVDHLVPVAIAKNSLRVQ